MRNLIVSLVAIGLGIAAGVGLGNLRVGTSESFEQYRQFRPLGDEPRPSVPAPGGVIAAPSGIQAPQIVVEEPTHKFGQMQRGSTKSHTFVVKNTGQLPLEIRDGGTTCKCTSFVVPQRPLAPGAAGEIKLTWVAKAEVGEFRQSATLLTNDPRASRLELSVEGAIVDVAGLMPQQWYLGTMRAGTEQTASVTLLAYQQEAVEVTRAVIEDESQVKWFDVKTVPLTKEELPDPLAKAGVRIDVTAKPGIPLGEINSWVLLESTLEPDPGSEKWERRIGIFGRVQGDLTIRGTRWSEETGAVTLGFVRSREGIEEKMFISAKGEHADGITFAVDKVDPPNLIEVELGEPHEIREGVTHTDLIVRVPKGLPPMIHLGNQQGEAVRVYLKTNHPVTPQMTFDVRFAVEQ